MSRQRKRRKIGKILGLDPGTAKTGYGIVRKIGDKKGKTRLQLVAYGTVETPANAYPPARLAIIFREVRKIIREHTPDMAAVEKLFFNINARTAMAVSQARGVILLACQAEHVPVAEVSPQIVKSLIGHHGRAPKKRMQIEVKRRLMLQETPKPDDAADALAVALAAISTM